MVAAPRTGITRACTGRRSTFRPAAPVMITPRLGMMMWPRGAPTVVVAVVGAVLRVRLVMLRVVVVVAPVPVVVPVPAVRRPRGRTGGDDHRRRRYEHDRSPHRPAPFPAPADPTRSVPIPPRSTHRQRKPEFAALGSGHVGALCCVAGQREEAKTSMTADTPRDLEGLPGLAAARTYAQLGRDLLALWASTGEQMIRLSVDTGETATDARSPVQPTCGPGGRARRPGSSAPTPKRCRRAPGRPPPPPGQRGRRSRST